MTLSFQGNLEALTRDLERAGHGIVRVLRFPMVPARRVEIHLVNGSRVNWDRLSQSIWIEGPEAARNAVYNHLWALYEAKPFARVWTLHSKQVGAVTLMAALAISGLALMASGWMGGDRSATLSSSIGVERPAAKFFFNAK